MNKTTTLRRITLGLAAVLAFATAAQAQIQIEITSGAEGALPIAIIPFVAEGGTPPEDVAGIVTNDLRRSGKFDPLPGEDLIARPTRFDDVQFPTWRALGVDSLVLGGVRRIDAQNYEVRFELVDIYAGRRLLGKRYRVPAGQLRQLAHNISDLIHESLTGQPGAANTQILYVQVEPKGEDKIHRLILADADGERPQVILTSPQPLMSPSWSPDRRQIAYVSFEGKRSEIYVQTVASGQREKVASFPGINGAPVWSPDSRRLALTLSKDGNPDIYVLDLASRQLRQITRHWAIDTEPTWSPDGRHIAFTSDRGGRPQIYRAPANGGDAERITFEGSYNASPDYSPDGRMMAMVHRDDRGFRIAVLDLQTQQLRVLTDGPLDEAPSFAPNSGMLAYAASQGGQSRLSTISVYGRANFALGAPRFPVREPAWSPR